MARVTSFEKFLYMGHCDDCLHRLGDPRVQPKAIGAKMTIKAVPADAVQVSRLFIVDTRCQLGLICVAPPG